MDAFSDTQLLFGQLAASPAEGTVKTLIENHDAWTHNAATARALNVTLRARIAGLARIPAAQAQIVAQRRALRPLLTRLPAILASAS
jgi:hypothetical protein